VLVGAELAPVHEDLLELAFRAAVLARHGLERTRSALMTSYGRTAESGKEDNKAGRETRGLLGLPYWRRTRQHSVIDSCRHIYRIA